MSIMGFFWASKEFFIGVREEVLRISWPSRREVWGNFVVVVFFIAIAALVLWCIDLVIKFCILKLYA